MVNSSSRRLADRYEVRSLIGRGGMAQVHLGFDTRLSRVVAIKILRSDLARDAIFQARFRREAQAAASLNHPNIVGVYDTGEEIATSADGTTVAVPFIVMEYVEGHTVKELLSDGTPVPISEAVEITSGVLSALEYSHAAGLVHRDIKPGNIMLTNDGKVKVMDFGIARAITDSQATMTQTNMVVGTAQYLSPEQARGEKVDERSDLYSTGCVLFELLTGQPPFKGDSAVAVAYQHVSEVPPAPSTIAGDIPESLDRVVMKALAKDPDERYSTAAQMRQEMTRAAQGLAVDAPETSSWTAVTTPMVAGVAATQVYQGPTRAGTTTTGTMAGIPGIDPDAVAEEKKSSKGKIAGIIALIVLALALVAGALYAVLGGGQSGEDPAQVAVPEGLVTMTEDQARSAIEEVGLVMELGDPVASNDVEKDLVAKTDPGSGQMVDTGGTVTVYLSAGPSSAEIPSMRGWTQEEARKALKDLGFEVGNVETVNDPDVDQDLVVKTSPEMGTTQPVGTTVNLFVASGKVEIPSLVGATEDEAVAALQELGLTAKVVSEPSEEIEEGRVISLSESGTVNKGTSVTVTVSTGSNMVDIPEDLVGQSEASVVKQLTDLGLVPSVDRQYSSDVDEGKVSAVSASGTVERGSAVVVTVSNGASPTPTPSPTPSEDND